MIRTLSPRARFTALGLAFVAGACGKDSSPLATSRLHLRDVTESAGIRFTTTSGKTPSSQILEVKGGGLAAIDHDHDGDFDVFVPNGATLDSPGKGPGARFFENTSDAGTIRFEDATEKTGITFDRWGFGPCVFDADGDGNDDLFVACYGSDAFLRNLGGRFEDETTSVGLAGDSNDWSTAAAAGDLDLDGDLDLYVVNYLAFDVSKPPERSNFLDASVFAGPKGLPPLPDRCHLNRGDGTFEERARELGFDSVAPGYGLGAAILDFDLDGRQDVFVGNDSGVNFLFVRGDDGKFTNVASDRAIATNGDGIEQATMGIAIGDVNADERPDLFTTNFMNDTNTLLVALEDGTYSDQTALYGLGVPSRPYVAWATAFCDFDHDLDEDLLVFDGHVYPKEITEPRKWNHDQVPQLYRREGRRFALATAADSGEWLGAARCDRSALFDDLDGDGDVDVIVNGLNQPIRVLENDGTVVGATRGVIVELVQSGSFAKNPRGLGSRIALVAGSTRQVRWIYSSGGYQSAQPSTAHFAVPSDAKVCTLEVTWPDGVSTTSEHEITPRIRSTR